MALTIAPLRPPRFQATQQRLVATRELRAAPSSVANAFSELSTYFEENLGTTFAAGDVTVQNPIKTMPSFDQLFLEDINVEEFGDEAIGDSGVTLDSNGLEVPKNGWRLTETYRTPTFEQGQTLTLPSQELDDMPDLPTDTFLTVRISLGMEMLAIDKAGLEWQLADNNGNKAIGVNTLPAVLVPTETINMTWHRVRYPPWTNIRALRGKLNEAVFFGHPVGTVMFLGLDGTREYQINGVRQWQLDYKFAVKEVKETANGVIIVAGWNEFYRPNPATNDPHWQTILKKSGVSIYEFGDLTQLFVSEQPSN